MKNAFTPLAPFILAAVFLLPVSVSLACGIEGRATRTDGSKVDGTARVSTSWNGNNIGKRSLPNDGNACVDFVLKGGSDMPVR